MQDNSISHKRSFCQLCTDSFVYISLHIQYLFIIGIINIIVFSVFVQSFQGFLSHSHIAHCNHSVIKVLEQPLSLVCYTPSEFT